MNSYQNYITFEKLFSYFQFNLCFLPEDFWLAFHFGNVLVFIHFNLLKMIRFNN